MKLTTLPSGMTIATIDGDTHIGRWVIESGRLDHDQNMLPLLDAYIPSGGVVLDIGAYIGDHTVYYADRVGEGGLVVAFEPNPEAFVCLHHNTKHLPQVVNHNVGASDSTHTIGIAKSPNGGASHATAIGGIACITIDSLAMGRCDFMKLDCEGYEPRALRGAQNTIAQHRPVMLIEINDEALRRQGYSSEELIAMVVAMGYTCRNIYSDQGMHGDQFDIICTP